MVSSIFTNGSFLLPFRFMAPTAAGHEAAVEAFSSQRMDEVPPNLKKILEACGKPYYDENRDRLECAHYYANVPPSQDGAQLYDTLHNLITRTHRERFGFDPEKRLFPWIDLRPNLRLQSIYSATPVAIDTPVRHVNRRDYIIKVKTPAPPRVRKDGSLGPPRNVRKKVDFRQQAEQWTKALLQGPPDAVTIAQRIAAVEGHRYFNAEHSVPQFFFDRARVPKGDLHHLFTCERMSNSLRGCRTYGETGECPEDRTKEGWAPKKSKLFEPDAGKGAVARATLYFLLRYPGEMGDKPEEYSPEDVKTLLQWHREDPVSLYEKHRNQAIADVQGNRNPLIDHPEWADRIDFAKAFSPLILAA